MLWKWNKKFRAGVLSLIALPAFASSCTDDDALSRPTATRDVYLQAAVGSTSPARSPYELTEPTVDNPLDALVLASGTSQQYEMPATDAWDPATLRGKTAARFFCGEPQLISHVKYPAPQGASSTGLPLYFVAMYPQEGWAIDTDANATFTFSGKEDVLFAPEVSGQYGASKLPVLTFKHLLTWLCVRIQAAGEGASRAWGDLKSLTIKSKSTVTLKPGPDVSPLFTNDTDMALYCEGTDDTFPKGMSSLPFGSAAPLEAYVLCAPLDIKENGEPTEEYTFVLETQHRKAEIPVKLKIDDSNLFTGSTMGCKFTVNLKLMLGFNIAPSASLVSWAYGGSGSANVTP